MADFLEPQTIVLIAGALFILAYLIIDQVILRLIVLVGTGFYIWYYFVAADTPLWGAIITSVLMGIANLGGLCGLYIQKSQFAVPSAHKDIYAHFCELPPGDFRALMKQGSRRVLEAEERVTQEGGVLTHLTYVVSGGMRVEKGGDCFNMPAGLFVGEVAYLMDQNSAATTWVNAGSEVLQWALVDLRAKSARRDRFKLALEAMISKDFAAKVQLAVAPNTQEWRTQ